MEWWVANYLLNGAPDFPAQQAEGTPLSLNRYFYICRVPDISHIAIVGAGNVARYLGKFLQPHFRVSTFARQASEGIHKISDLQGFLPGTDLILLCVSDNAISEVSENLPATTALVAHVSGATALDKISSKHKRRGVFYPLMSIRHNSNVDPSIIPFCLEAESEDDYKLMEDVVSALGASHHRVSSGQRNYLHVAAVLSQNFSNHLFHKSSEILGAQNLDFRILLPLLRNSLNRLETQKPGDVQTGPAVRNDTETIKKHLELIDDRETREIYKMLSDSIQNTYDKKL